MYIYIYNIRHRAVGTCCVFRGVGEAPVLQGSSVQLKFISSTRFQVEVGGWRLELGVGGWRLEVGVPTPTPVMFLRDPPQPSSRVVAWILPPWATQNP